MKDDSLLSSTVGKKIVMSVSGLILFVYIVLHMLGNLQVFIGREAIDQYADFLKHGLGGEMEKVLWIMRVVLLGALIAHVWFALALYSRSWQARKHGYAKRQWVKANVSSRSMIYGGLFLLLFIVFHIAHFTLGTVGFDQTVLVLGNRMPWDHAEVYRNVFYSFTSPVLAGLYILSMVFLGLHLYHGSWSMFQTLGVNHPRWEKTLQRTMRTIGVLIAVGFALVPLLIVTGIAQPEEWGPNDLPSHYERVLDGEQEESSSALGTGAEGKVAAAAPATPAVPLGFRDRPFTVGDSQAVSWSVAIT